MLLHGQVNVMVRRAYRQGLALPTGQKRSLLPVFYQRK